MSDIHAPNNSQYSSSAEDFFISKIEEGAALTCVNGTGGSKSHMAGFVWDKHNSNSDWNFSGAEPTFIFGNTCSIGNTSNPNANTGTVLQDLLFDAQSGIAGFFGPTVYTNNSHV